VHVEGHEARRRRRRRRRPCRRRRHHVFRTRGRRGPCVLLLLVEGGRPVAASWWARPRTTQHEKRDLHVMIMIMFMVGDNKIRYSVHNSEKIILWLYQIK
jgi:hypothetical protein